MKKTKAPCSALTPGKTQPMPTNTTRVNQSVLVISKATQASLDQTRQNHSWWWPRRTQSMALKQFTMMISWSWVRVELHPIGSSGSRQSNNNYKITSRKTSIWYLCQLRSTPGISNSKTKALSRRTRWKDQWEGSKSRRSRIPIGKLDRLHRFDLEKLKCDLEYINWIRNLFLF